MSKYCPIINAKVVYLECLECENKVCTHIHTESKQPSTNNIGGSKTNPTKTTSSSTSE